MDKFLGIDFGEKYLGLAIASGPLAEPYQTIHTHQAIALIPALIQTNHTQAIIIGLSEGRMAQKTKKFGKKLAQLTGLPIYYQDETLSSYETRLHAAQAGKKKSARERKIDHLVAAAILQNYLDSHINR